MAGGDDRAGLAGRLAADLSALDAELAEIDLLIAQATAEAERHEQKRAAASDRLAVAQALPIGRTLVRCEHGGLALTLSDGERVVMAVAAVVVRMEFEDG